MPDDRFPSLARYNAWANRRLYDSVATLSDAEVGRARPAAYFGSILGTLNHILVGDRIWLGRIEGPDAGLASLDQILHRDLAGLHAARQSEDARIIAFVDRLAADDLEKEIGYRTTIGEPWTTPLGDILIHLFNHQTHHRGQTHALIKEAGAEPPPLDFIYYLREAG